MGTGPKQSNNQPHLDLATHRVPGDCSRSRPAWQGMVGKRTPAAVIRDEDRSVLVLPVLRLCFGQTEDDGRRPWTSGRGALGATCRTMEVCRRPHSPCDELRDEEVHCLRADLLHLEVQEVQKERVLGSVFSSAWFLC